MMGEHGPEAARASRDISTCLALLRVRRLEPWHAHTGERRVRSPKVYVRDSGLSYALLASETRNDLPGHPVVGARSGGFDIRLGKAVARAEERRLRGARAGVGEAISKIERRRTASFAIPCTGVDRQVARFGRDGAHVGVRKLQKVFNGALCILHLRAQTAPNSEGCVPDRQRRGETLGGVLYARQQFVRVLLAGEDGGERRCVDRHQCSPQRLLKKSLSAFCPASGFR